MLCNCIKLELSCHCMQWNIPGIGFNMIEFLQLVGQPDSAWCLPVFEGFKRSVVVAATHADTIAADIKSDKGKTEEVDDTRVDDAVADGFIDTESPLFMLTCIVAIKVYVAAFDSGQDNTFAPIPGQAY